MENRYIWATQWPKGAALPEYPVPIAANWIRANDAIIFNGFGVNYWFADDNFWGAMGVKAAPKEWKESAYYAFNYRVGMNEKVCSFVDGKWLNDSAVSADKARQAVSAGYIGIDWS